MAAALRLFDLSLPMFGGSAMVRLCCSATCRSIRKLFLSAGARYRLSLLKGAWQPKAANRA